MHDCSVDPPTIKRWSKAVTQVDEYFSNFPTARRLSEVELERYIDRGFKGGWQLRVDEFVDGAQRTLNVLVDRDFPYQPPRVVVVNGPELLSWTHLEEDGFLCLLPSGAAVSHDDPVSVIKSLLGETCNVVKANLRGDQASGFRNEFLSYWSRAKDKDARGVISLLEPQGPTRRIYLWHGKHKYVAGESPEALRRWLEHWGAQKPKGQDYVIHDGALIWLEEPMVPSEYPSKAAEVRQLAQLTPDGSNVLEALVGSDVAQIDVLLGAPTPNAACFGAVRLRRPARSGVPGRKADPVTKGFRPGQVPKSVQVNRYFSPNYRIVKRDVERADHLWIHGRDQDVRQNRLRNARVAVLGCGSVGGPLARLLAQAGVANLLLVDPAHMDWPNVGRHVLGADSVNHGKATQLARAIEEAFPHLNDILWRREKVGPSARELMRDLLTYDLVVSTMGDWSAESFLNDWQRSHEDAAPILYGWVEPNALAAHGILIPRGGACLRCGTNSTGQPNFRVTEWPNGGDMLQEPACAAVFTPYGPTELCWAHALLSELVMDALLADGVKSRHRVWISSRSRIEGVGAVLSESYVREIGDPGQGQKVVERVWKASPSCPVCAGRAHAA